MNLFSNLRDAEAISQLALCLQPPASVVASSWYFAGRWPQREALVPVWPVAVHLWASHRLLVTSARADLQKNVLGPLFFLKSIARRRISGCTLYICQQDTYHCQKTSVKSQHNIGLWHSSQQSWFWFIAILMFNSVFIFRLGLKYYIFIYFYL